MCASKEAERLVHALLKSDARFRAHATGPMVELALTGAANNEKQAPAALAVLERAKIGTAQLSVRVVDILPRPSAASAAGGGGGGGVRTPWERMLLHSTCPKLNDLLMLHPRLHRAAHSLDVLLEALTPQRHAAALRLVKALGALPPALYGQLLQPDATGGSKWAALVRDAACARLVDALLAREPRLARGGRRRLARLHPSTPPFSDRPAVGQEVIDLLFQAPQGDASDEQQQQQQQAGAPPPALGYGREPHLSRWDSSCCTGRGRWSTS